MGCKGSLLLAMTAVVYCAGSSSAVVIYRIGAPFSAAEQDSLQALGIDLREISWSAFETASALELDSLEAGVVQPNFFGHGEDIAATLLDRGGKACVINTSYSSACHAVDAVRLIDRDPTTAHVYPEIAAESFNRDIWERVTFDVGGRFLIREVRFRTLAKTPEHFLERFTIGIADGFNAIRIPHFPDIIAEVKENTASEVSVFLEPPVTTSAIQLRIFRQTTKEVGLADFELYGGGFVSEASYESEVIEMDELASWGEIRWAGRQDPGARVDIRSRSGNDPQPEVFWRARPEQQDSIRYLQGGGTLSFSEYKRQYARLSDFLKPADESDWISLDSENWSFWSSPYEFEQPGVAVVSPGPRRYFQLRADFISTVDEGGKLDYLEFKASVPPAVRRLVGEIFPTETEVGKATQFTYYIRPTIRSGDRSFDAVEISTPSGVISVDSLRIDGIDQAGFLSTIRDDGLGFEVQLPRRLQPADNGALVEVGFNAPVLREVGTHFGGRVFDTAQPFEVRQRVIPGDATDAVDGDRLSVTTSLGNSVVFAPDAAPNPFTPNGDGINDLLNISYKLLRVTAAVPVAIEVFDLSGRMVKQVYAGEDLLGDYRHVWDGTDHSNTLVSPGLYLYRLAVDVQSDQETTGGVVSVVY